MKKMNKATLRLVGEVTVKLKEIAEICERLQGIHLVDMCVIYPDSGDGRHYLSLNGFSENGEKMFGNYDFYKKEVSENV